MASTSLPAGLSKSDINGLTPSTLQQLGRLQDQNSTSLTIPFYPISAIVMCLILYVSAKLVHRLFMQMSSAYRDMSLANQRTSTIYVLNVFYTTSVLVLQFIASPALAKKYTVEGVDLIRISGLIISLLYLFEMTYRMSMRPQMIIHHLATLFAICFVAAVLSASSHPSLIVTALMWIFQASTEQATFIALLLYRLGHPARRVAWLLRFSAIQTLIPKFGSAIYLLVWWGREQVQNTSKPLDVAFSVILFVCLFTLMPTQVYGSWVLWKVAHRISKKDANGAGAMLAQPGLAGKDEEAGEVDCSMAISSSEVTVQALHIRSPVTDDGTRMEK